MKSRPRVVITGLGAVCGAGRTVDGLWEAVCAGRSAIAPIRQWDAGRWPARMAAEVTGVSDRDLVEDRKLHKMLTRTDLFGLYAAGQAIEASGLPAHRATLEEAAATRFNDRSGIFAGSGGGNYGCNYELLPLLAATGPDLPRFGRELCDSVNPMWLLRILPNNVLCHLGIRHTFKGTNACITNHCVGGVAAVAEAAQALRTGEADRAVAVGHDAPLEPEAMLHYYRLGLLSPELLRPFDERRQGTVMGEGAGAVLLETAGAARARGAPVLGEFLGSGCTNGASGILNVRADGDDVRRVIELSLADAGVKPAEVGMIVAHGNGVPASDASEALAIRAAFGGDPPPVTAFKWAYGHLFAASGVVDLVMALLALRHRLVPGIASLDRLDPGLAPFPVSRSHQEPRGPVALILCRGFGGMNMSLVVRGAAAPAIE